MESQTRRGFLADVGKGMLVASVGVPLAAELGATPAHAEVEGDTNALSFGRLVQPGINIDHFMPRQNLCHNGGSPPRLEG